MLAPLQLLDFHLLEFHLQANPSFEPADQSEVSFLLTVRGGEMLEPEQDLDERFVDFSVDVTTELIERGMAEDGRLKLRLLVETDVNTHESVSAHAPYRARATAFGEFAAARVPEEDEERQKVLQIIRANAAGIIYGSLRTLLTQAMQLSPHPPLMLPSLSFRHIVEREIELQAAEEEEEV